MTEPGFKIVDDLPSADFVFDAFGENLEDLFVNCAKACFYCMTDLEKVLPIHRTEFEVRGETVEDLLFSFIAELIYLKDTKKTFFSDFNVRIADDRDSLNAVVTGEPIDYNKHVIKTDVKAATYHDLHVREKNGRYVVRMILDL